MSNTLPLVTAQLFALIRRAEFNVPIAAFAMAGKRPRISFYGNIKRVEGKKMGKDNVKLTVPEKHQLKIAKATLNMSEIGARIMGGPNHEEAREIILRLTGKSAKDT